MNLITPGRTTLASRAAAQQGRISNLMPEQPEHDAMMFVADHDATGPIEPFVTFGIDDESGMRLTN